MLLSWGFNILHCACHGSDLIYCVDRFLHSAPFPLTPTSVVLRRAWCSIPLSSPIACLNSHQSEPYVISACVRCSQECRQSCLEKVPSFEVCALFFHPQFETHPSTRWLPGITVSSHRIWKTTLRTPSRVRRYYGEL